MDRYGIYMLLAIVALVGLIVVLSLYTPDISGTVTGKHYTPSSTGVGPSMGQDGGVAVTFHAAKYTLEVKDESGKFHMVNVSKRKWHHTSVGDTYDSEEDE